jgi:polyhydroxyalkanoate synthesis regulator protein
METIVKYNNRKLYSKMSRSYVDLPYIADLVRTSQKFEVTDHKSKENITKETVKNSLMTVDISMDAMVKLIRGN